jgi:hypothetical protein
LVLADPVLNTSAPNLPVNIWQPVEVDWKKTLTEAVLDGNWQTGDGFSDNVFRTKTGELLIRTGISSKSRGLSPGFYTNTTVALSSQTHAARVVEVSSWGGGSSGGGSLPPDFEKQPMPSPRHTYDGICYVPGEDALYLMLGANTRIGGRDADDASKRQLAIDNGESTWRYDFTAGRWTRVDHNVRKFWPGAYAISPYESHLAHWPEAGKLIFLDDGGSHYAEFDLKTQQWEKRELVNACPFRLYNARSTWDARRALWVFRLGPKLCTFDPKQREFATLPDCWMLPEPASPEARKQEPRWASKGVCYLAKYDKYLVTGPTGNDTRVFDPAQGTWSDLKAGDIALVNGYCQYDSQADVVWLSYQLNCFQLKYREP